MDRAAASETPPMITGFSRSFWASTIHAASRARSKPAMMASALEKI